MKRFFVTLAAAGLLVGLIAGPVAAAPGGVARNQVTTINYSFAIGGGHNFVFVFNPCDGSITATGGASYTTETVIASLSNGMISMTSVYNEFLPGYTWTATFPLTGGTITLVAGGVTYTGIVVTASTPSVTTWANHGDYVSSNGGGSDLAHSCIGMPIVTP